MTTFSRLCLGIAMFGMLLLGEQIHAQTVINTVTDLQAMQNNLTGSYVLGGDIDATATASWNGGTGFIPVGPFTGTFDGQGHTITGLVINSTAQGVGLFGNLGGNATVRNVILAQISVTSAGSGSSVGTLVGSMGYNGTSVSNSSASGSINSANASRVGGLVGWNYAGTITGCAASTAVTSTTTGGSIGGLVGENQYLGPQYIGGGAFYPGVTANSQASGSVTGNAANIGGLVGYNTSTVKQSRASGSVTGGGNSSAGGLIGYNGPSAYSPATGNTYLVDSVEDSFSTSTVVNGSGGSGGGLIGVSVYSWIIGDFATGSVSNSAGGSAEGGLIGHNEASTVEQSYATGSVTGTSSTALAGLIGIISTWNGLHPTIQQTYSIGAVQGLYSGCAGGLVGCDSSGSGASCSYWATDTSFQSNSADGTGILLAELETGMLPGCFASSIWTTTAGALPTLIANPAPSTGYIDTKYQVLGVTYAPPGPSTSTYVQYQNSSLVGNSQTLSQSFENSKATSVTLSANATFGVLSGSISRTVSSTVSQTTKDSTTVTTSVQVQEGEKTAGTINYFAPVNHDYDIIWIWLNPAVILTVYPPGSAGSSATGWVDWNGYGFDMSDQPDMDILGLPLGYLNGDFGRMPPQYQISLSRAWAQGQVWASGQGPALTSSDLMQIAAADPFSNVTYGPTVIGIDPPAPETADLRFTLSACNGSYGFPYVQANPSAGAETYTCSLTNTNTSIQARDSTSSYQQSYSLDSSLKATAFGISLGAELKDTTTLTWTTEQIQQITNTTVAAASLSVQDPPCNNVLAGLGPCVPVYDLAGNEPVQFAIYQDNLYGTFMFAPIGYYTATPTTVGTPTFSPGAGTFNSPQTVTISDPTSGAVIYYTTDGTTPTIVSNQYTGPVAIKVSETIQAISVASGYTPSAVGAAVYTITGLGPAAIPTFSVAAGTYSQPQSVSLADATPGATIFYTTNGLAPTTSSAVYSGPITVNSSETIDAIAIANGYTTSSVASAAYTITNLQTATPAFSLASATYLSSQMVTIYDATPGAVIYYTTNGTTPTTNSPVYGGSIIVSATELIQAIAVAPGSTQSNLASALYTITPPTAAPTFSTSSGTYTTGLTVSISDAVSGAVIYFTTNGTPPTTSSPVYTSPITVNATETIQAMAVASGSSPSAIAVAVYTISTPTATPIFNPLPGTFTTTQTVTISDGTPGATIYFTTNGTTPTVGSSVYTGAITVSSSTTIQAIAIAAGDSTSALGTAAYTITSPPTTATPTMSVPQGAYSSTQMVTISDATPGAAIYYTTNGSQPTTASTPYTTAITVGTTETIEAIAIAPGYSTSTTASAAYTINPPGADFQIAASASTLSIVQGKSSTATITITPEYGFGAQVSFGCGGLPSEATCNFSPVSVTPSGSPQSSTLTISTTASSAMLHDSNRGVGQIAFAVLLPGFVMMWSIAPGRRNLAKALRPLALLLLLMASLGITACGSGTTGSALFGNPGTPTGSAVVTVYGVSNGATATTHEAFISVTVTQ